MVGAPLTMGLFAIAATAEVVVEGRMDEFLERLLARRVRCLRNEPGTLRVDVLRPKNGPTGLSSR